MGSGFSPRPPISLSFSLRERRESEHPKKNELAMECAKLGRSFELSLAEEGLSEDLPSGKG